MNYGHTLTIAARRMRLPGIPLFPTPNEQENGYQDR